MTAVPERAVSLGFAMGIGILVLTLLSGCSRLAASPALSPLPAVSPLPTAAVAESPVAATPTGEVVPPGAPILDLAFDLEKAVLGPQDMSDLFEVSYSVAQPYERAGMRGLQVLYPSKAIQHTTGFAEGFSTRLEIYAETSGVVEAFRAAVGGQRGVPFAMPSLGDASQASLVVTDSRGQEVAPESPEASNFAYSVVVRRGNVLAIIAVRAPRSIPAERLAQAAETVLSRLQASAS